MNGIDATDLAIVSVSVGFGICSIHEQPVCGVVQIQIDVVGRARQSFRAVEADGRSLARKWLEILVYADMIGQPHFIRAQITVACRLIERIRVVVVSVLIQLAGVRGNEAFPVEGAVARPTRHRVHVVAVVHRDGQGVRLVERYFKIPTVLAQESVSRVHIAVSVGIIRIIGDFPPEIREIVKILLKTVRGIRVRSACANDKPSVRQSQSCVNVVVKSVG